MNDLKQTLTELKDIITQLKTHADSSSSLSGVDKTKLEARIKHLQDKTQDHSQSSAKLDLDLNDLDNLETLIGKDKTAWSNKTKVEVADKLNSSLITGLTTLINTGLKKPKKKADGTDEKDAQGNLVYEDIFDKTLMDTIKASVEEIKTKGVQVDLTELQSKLEAIKLKTDTLTGSGSEGAKGGTPHWSIGAAVTGGISVLLLGYIAFFKLNPSRIHESKENE